MTLTGAATAFATASAILGIPAHADMAAELSLCLDTKLDIPARAAAFEDQGWLLENDERQIREIFTAGATLGTLDALEPGRWTGTRVWADNVSDELVNKTASGDAIVLKSADLQAAVVLQRNMLGLQTCFYVGNDPALIPVEEVLDGSILRIIGSVHRIRGDGPKSSISAHFLDDTGRRQIDPPLRFGTTFTLILDRQPGDLQ